MVKSLHTITIRDYALFEQTGDLSYLMRYRLPLARFYKTRATELVAEIAKRMGSDADQDTETRKEFHRLKTYMRIQSLIVLYQAVYNLMVNKARVDVWREAIGKGRTTNYSNLIEYVAKIKQLTGIEFEPDDWELNMIELKEEIDRTVDKYNENFLNNKQAGADGVTFMQIVLGVFSTLQAPIDESIRLTVFFEMKKQAEEMIRHLKLKQDGRQN